MQIILAKVLHISDDRVYVDAKFHSLSELYRPDLGLSHVHTPGPNAPLASRTGTSDVRIGDIVKVSRDTAHQHGQPKDVLHLPSIDMQMMKHRHCEPHRVPRARAEGANHLVLFRAVPQWLAFSPGRLML